MRDPVPMRLLHHVRTHSFCHDPALPDINSIFYSSIYSSTLAYIVDANVGRSSSAVALNSCFRGSLGFVAAEIAVPLQVRVDYLCLLSYSHVRRMASEMAACTRSGQVCSSYLSCSCFLSGGAVVGGEKQQRNGRQRRRRRRKRFRI